MAQKVEVEWTSDLGGEELGPEDAKGFRFAVDGTIYTIDLKYAEAQAFREFAWPYMRAARKVGRLPTAGPYLVANQPKAKRDPDYNMRVREWAKAMGYQVADRGAVKKPIIDAFEAAKGQVIVTKPKAAPTPAPERADADQPAPQLTTTGARTTRAKSATPATPPKAKTATAGKTKTTAATPTTAAATGTKTRRGTTSKARSTRAAKTESA